MASLDDAEKIGGDILAGKAPPKQRTKWDDMEDRGATVLDATPPPAATSAVPPAAAPMPTVDEWGNIVGAPLPGQTTFNRVANAAAEGYRDTQPVLTPYARDIYNQTWLGRNVANPLFDTAGAVIGAGAGFGRGLGQSAYEVGNLLDPALGRDLYMGTQVGGALLPQMAGPRAGLMPPEAPPFSQGAPRSVMERMQPPPVEGQSTLGRINALLRHDEQWTNPDAPGYQANNPLDTRVLPPADAPPGPPPGMIPPPGSSGGAPTPPTGPRVGGTPPGVIPNGLTPEQMAEHVAIPESLPPLKKEIVTPQDAADRADDIINHFASTGNREPVPGATGSLPTITQNSGLATLYRAVRDKDTPVPFTQLEDAAKANAKGKLAVMTGGETPEAALDNLNAAVKQRADTVDPLYKQAWANKGVADPSGPIGVVDDLMKSPLMQNDTAMAELTKIRKKLEGQTDPEQLKGITDAIDGTVAELNTAGKADRYTRAALAKVDDAITGEISRVTPGFDTAQATYANLSKRIDEMKYFQSRKLTDLQGNPTLAQMRSTIDDIRGKQAGDKFHPADSVTPENLQTLKDLHDQTQRERFTDSAGKSLGGSNTFQNLATDSVMRTVGKQVGANVLGIGTGYLGDLAMGGGGEIGAGLGFVGGNALQAYGTVKASQAAARQAAGQAMLMQALRERLLNFNNKGIDALRRSP